MTDNILEVPVRFYQIAQLYGPGMARSGQEGLHEKALTKSIGQVGLVLVHCWNLGEATGPYPIGTDAHCPGQAADWVPTAHGIIRDYIRPVLDAARQGGMAVFHLAQNTYAGKYATYRTIKDDPELQGPPGQSAGEVCVRPRSPKEQWQDEYGPEFPGCVWQTHRDSFNISELVRPVGDEPVVVNGWQLNGLCRRMDIDTLFYAGFMADLCLLNVQGAVREMANKFKYRCVVLRDCTTAYEYTDTVAGGWMTKAAIRHVEADLGYSASAEEFIGAVSKLH